MFSCDSVSKHNFITGIHFTGANNCGRYDEYGKKIFIVGFTYNGTAAYFHITSPEDICLSNTEQVLDSYMIDEIEKRFKNLYFDASFNDLDLIAKAGFSIGQKLDSLKFCTKVDPEGIPTDFIKHNTDYVQDKFDELVNRYLSGDKYIHMSTFDNILREPLNFIKIHISKGKNITKKKTNDLDENLEGLFYANFVKGEQNPFICKNSTLKDDISIKVHASLPQTYSYDIIYVYSLDNYEFEVIREGKTVTKYYINTDEGRNIDTSALSIVPLYGVPKTNPNPGKNININIP